MWTLKEPSSPPHPSIPADRQAYEVVGLRENGDTYTVEVLGEQTEAAALELAQRCADKWQHTVNLYRVPFVHIGSQPWTDEQMQFVQQLPPTVPLRR